MTDSPRVGFVGLGMMGNPMARRIIDAGFTVVAYDIEPSRLQAVVAAGATSADSARDVAARSDIVLTSLPSLEACEATYLGPEGLLRGAAPGSMLVETSTVTPGVVRRFAAAASDHDVSVLDASLIARTTFHPGMSSLTASDIAARGLVTVFVGGDEAQVTAVRPVLSTFGNPIFHVGPLGSGAMVKVLSNAAAHAYFLVALEVNAVAAKAGVDLQKLEEIFRHTPARSVAMNETIPHFLEHGEGMMMSLQAGIKDAESMLELAEELQVPVRMQGENLAYYRLAAEHVGPDAKWDTALMQLFEGYIDASLRFDPTD